MGCKLEGYEDRGMDPYLESSLIGELTAVEFVHIAGLER